MPKSMEAPDLSSLMVDYDIIGELNDVRDARTYIARRQDEDAKRRDDAKDVLITIVTTPEGDEGKALDQLAADTKLLAGTSHRRLVPVLDGRWVGDDAFAVVTQRISDPSLAQRLLTAETFSNPRIAAILREVNGLLEWARERQIVHRAIPTSRLYLEPNTDRVRVTFAIAPIRRLHQSDARDDARTVLTLATAMLTGEPDSSVFEGKTLAELRPDLPQRLHDAATALLDEKTADQPDVAGFLALIGMADPVAAGEAERERIRNEILDEQRAEREKLAAEREEFQRTMAEEREKHQRQMAEELEKHQRTMSDEIAKHEREREELQKTATREREELKRAAASERDKLVAKRAELERIVAEQRAELERVAAQDRQLIATLREELQAAGERELEAKRQAALEEIAQSEDEEERNAFNMPGFLPPELAPLQPLDFDDTTPLMSGEKIVFADAQADAQDDPPVSVPARFIRNRSRWVLTAALVLLAAVIALGANYMRHRQPAVRAAASPATRQSVSAAVIDPRPATPRPAASNPTGTPAAAAAAAAPVATPPAPVGDSVRVDAARRWLDSLKRANPVEISQAERPRPVREVPVERRQPTIEENPFFIPGSTTPARPAVPPVSTVPVQSYVPPAPTSTPDTSPRRDSLRPVDPEVTPV
jgi:hypothetical protein